MNSICLYLVVCLVTAFLETNTAVAETPNSNGPSVASSTAQNSPRAPGESTAVAKFLKKEMYVEPLSSVLLSLKRVDELKHGLSRRGLQVFDEKGQLSSEANRTLVEGYSKESLGDLNDLLFSLGLEVHNNAMILGQAGVGKTFLLNQLVDILTFGVLPEEFNEEFGSAAHEKGITGRIRDAFFKKTQMVAINHDLLSRDTTEAGKAFPKSEVRMKRMLLQIFERAKEDFQKQGIRTVFVMEEVATLPPSVQEALKSLLDTTGFKTEEDSISELGRETGYSVIGITTPVEYNRMLNGDSAIDRRYKKILVREPSHEAVLKILEKKKSYWETRYNFKIGNGVFDTFIFMRKFFANPPLAMPDSILKIMQSFLLWCSKDNNCEAGGEITVSDAQKYLISYAKLPPEVWVRADGRPPLWDLEERVNQVVIGQQEAVHEIVTKLKEGRLNGFEEVPVFFLIGPSGSGKDTIAKAINQIAFGHSGAHLNFNLANSDKDALEAIFEGPPLGTPGDSELPLILKAMAENSPNGVIVLNEAKDLPSDQFDRLKVIVESGEIVPKGRDSRPRPFGVNAIFILGQWGEELFQPGPDGKMPTEEQIQEIMAKMTTEKLEEILQAGKNGGKQGAVPFALIQRAKRRGGIVFLRPVSADGFIDIAKLSLKRIEQSMLRGTHNHLIVDDSIPRLAAQIAELKNVGPRSLDGILQKLTQRPLTYATDQGLQILKDSAQEESFIYMKASGGQRIEIRQEVKDLTGQIIKEKSFEYDVSKLMWRDCGDLLKP